MELASILLIIIFTILSFFGLILTWGIIASKNSYKKLGKLILVIFILIFLVIIAKNIL